MLSGADSLIEKCVLRIGSLFRRLAVINGKLRVSFKFELREKLLPEVIQRSDRSLCHADRLDLGIGKRKDLDIVVR